MLIRQLEYVVAVAREGHFGRAAASCWVSQPTLSDGVSSLEAELGVLIIRRGRRYGGLTPEGERVVLWARRVLAERDDLLAELAGGDAAAPVRVRLGVVPAALPVSGALSRLVSAPVLTVREMPAEEIVHGLGRYELDGGITYLGGETAPGLRTVALYRERYVLLTPASGPAGAGGPVGWREVAELPLCLPTPAVPHRRALDEWLACEGVTIEPRLETDSPSLLVAAVRGGVLSAVVPASWTGFAGVPPGVRVVGLPGLDPAPTVGLAVVDRDPPRPAARVLLDAVACAVKADGEGPA